MNKTPMVSVVMITYNHEKYIEEAIDGVLMQNCDFDVELIIANDKSTDHTDQVIQKTLQKDTPENLHVRYYSHETNKGMMTNFLWSLKQAQGEYIALCEGDDYWTNSLKLQKQVDFLNKNEEYGICFHRVSILQNGKLESDQNDITEKRFNKITDKSKIGIDDLLKQGNFIHTPSVMFRKSDLGIMPFETKYSTVGDYFLYILLTTKNNRLLIKLEDQMAVYRRGVGVYSSMNSIDISYSVLQYKICILSYLDMYNQKEILLKQILNQLNGIKKRELGKNKISDFTFRELILQLLKKIKRRVL